jgi:rod shape-determining protein MreC
MAVITTNGIAGIVRDVSSNYALVLSVLNPDFHVNAKIKELDELGSITWDGKDRQVAVLNDIPSHVKLKKGQKVVVGPYSKYFPEDYPIGVVEDFELDETGSFYRVRVKLSTVVRNLEVVYIIDRSGIDEQENLEKEVVE